ncbi:hypothetical protein [Legionella tunisiensis]|uniref:hypothetical protein n=1 Tax=Legionella tunisiensis TaxID=1034944 RepID=UPI0002E1422B|nr:hypothetical protein [Legionella tunisiensis]
MYPAKRGTPAFVLFRAAIAPEISQEEIPLGELPATRNLPSAVRLALSAVVTVLVPATVVLPVVVDVSAADVDADDPILEFVSIAGRGEAHAVKKQQRLEKDVY